MNDTRIPKFMYEYIPTGKRDVARPRKQTKTHGDVTNVEWHRTSCCCCCCW